MYSNYLASPLIDFNDLRRWNSYKSAEVPDIEGIGFISKQSILDLSVTYSTNNRTEYWSLGGIIHRFHTSKRSRLESLKAILTEMGEIKFRNKKFKSKPNYVEQHFYVSLFIDMVQRLGNTPVEFK